MKNLRGRRGFTMVEMLVGVSILTVSLTGFTAMYLQNHRNYLHSLSKTTQMELMRDLQLKMSSKLFCEHNLKGLSLSQSGELALTQIKDESNKPLLQKGSFLGAGTSLSNMRIRVPNTLWQAYKKTASANAAAEIPLNTSLEVSFSIKSFQGEQALTQNILLPLKLAANRAIKECLGVSPDLLLAALIKNCESLGAFYDQSQSACVLSEKCGKIEANKPVSQKCLAAQLVTLEKRIADQVKRIPQASGTLEPGYFERKKASIVNCFKTSNSISTYDGVLRCNFGQGYNVGVSIDNVSGSSGMGIKTTFDITDPAITKEFYDTVKAIYDQRKGQ